MTFTKQVLRLMEDGKPHTMAELRAATGADTKSINHALHSITRNGYAEVVPFTYTITAQGRKRIEVVPDKIEKERVRAVLKQRRYRVTKKMQREAEEAAAKANEGHRIVDTALRTRPALDMAWMSVARTQEGAHA